jgi:hypothetical protein
VPCGTGGRGPFSLDVIADVAGVVVGSLVGIVVGVGAWSASIGTEAIEA